MNEIAQPYGLSKIKHVANTWVREFAKPTSF